MRYAGWITTGICALALIASWTFHTLTPLVMAVAPIVAATITAGVAVSAVTEPPQPLRERSILFDQLTWLARMAIGTFVVGAGAYLGIAAQADFDAHRQLGLDAQFDAVLRDCFAYLVPVLVGGSWVLLARATFALWRTSAFDRFRAAWTVAAWVVTDVTDVSNRRPRNVIAQLLFLLSAPKSLAAALIAVPFFLPLLLPAG